MVITGCCAERQTAGGCLQGVVRTDRVLCGETECCAARQRGRVTS